MNNLLIQIYQSAATKYRKFRKRLDKNISTGRFKHFTRKKQHQLTSKVERLRKRLLQLQTQLKLAGAAAALGLFLQTPSATAQTSVGPFNRNYIDNPLPPPMPFFHRPASSYVDLDNDGDLDLAVGTGNQLHYFKNIGTKEEPFFLNIDDGDSEFPFNAQFDIPSNRSRYVPAFVDIDNDGDFDMLIGSDKYNLVDVGEIHFFENEGSATSPDFVHKTGSENPFDGIQSTRNGYPTLVDFDIDGDYDLFFGGYYGYEPVSYYSYVLKYYENTGTASAPEFTLDTGNPLVSEVNALYGVGDSPNAFADLDEDGDLDFFFSVYDKIIYLRNDGGTFDDEISRPSQTGPWQPNAAQPQNSLGNPFDEINQNVPDDFATGLSFSFADLDDDGDLDVTVNYDLNYSQAALQRPIIYFENTGQGVFERKDGLNSPVDGVSVGGNSNASFADMDGDGDLDIFASGYTRYTICPDGCFEVTNRTIKIYENDNGTIIDVTVEQEEKFNIDLPQHNATAKLLYLDGDDTPDLVVSYLDEDANPDVGYVKYFELQGGVYVERTGSANPFSDLVIGDRINLDVGDLNNDGLPDLIIGTRNNELTAYRNTGTLSNPAFTRETSWESGFTTEHIGGSNPKLIDIDNDADLEIVVGKYNDIWYYENTGTPEAPQFVQRTEGSTANPFRTITTGFGFGAGTPRPSFLDVDGDGDQDLIYGDGSGEFSYYENQNPHAVTTLNPATLDVSGGTPVVIDNTLTVADSDTDPIVLATVTIEDFRPGDEALSFTPLAGITGIFDSGVLTFHGTATAANYQTILRSVTYNFSGTVPGGRRGRMTAIDRTINIEVFDADRTTPDVATRTLHVTSGVNSAPTIQPDPVSATIGGTITRNIAPFIDDSDGNFSPTVSTVTITQQPTSGATASLNFVSSSVVELTVNYGGLTFEGLDQLQIQACDDLGACATSVVTIQVGLASELNIFNAFSPNTGDNINAFFHIEHIESVSPQNKVTIFNRWGDIVFEVKDYNNSQADKRFEGVSDNGKDLPTGTYFYKIEITGQTLTGYLSLKR